MEVPKINNMAVNYNINQAASKVENDEFKKKLQSAMDSNDEQQLKKVSQDLESVFMNMMMQEMKNTINKSDLTPSDPGSDEFQSMFYEKVSEIESQGKGMGLADMIYKQVSNEMKNKYKIQE